ncbi:MAG: hypothetical protein HKN25_14455 [Pyrinomonadaceae bacterium]|nr:hypothetical protein [Pyrinomonadaceae bacterium]
MNPETEKRRRRNSEMGYSLIELIGALVLTLVILSIAVTVFTAALGSRLRETGNTDAVTSAQAALNVMSREIGNSGYGLSTNGIVFADTNRKKLRIRANINNQNNQTDTAGEDVQFFYDSASQSVVRYDRNTGTVSGMINQVSDVDFIYTDFAPNGSTTTSTTAASVNTGRVTINLQVILPDVQGQPANRRVQVSTDVTLRNSTYHLGQY